MDSVVNILAGILVTVVLVIFFAIAWLIFSHPGPRNVSESKPRQPQQPPTWQEAEDDNLEDYIRHDPYHPGGNH